MDPIDQLNRVAPSPIPRGILNVSYLHQHPRGRLARLSYRRPFACAIPPLVHRVAVEQPEQLVEFLRHLIPPAADLAPAEVALSDFLLTQLLVGHQSAVSILGIARAQGLESGQCGAVGFRKVEEGTEPLDLADGIDNQIFKADDDLRHFRPFFHVLRPPPTEKTLSRRHNGLAQVDFEIRIRGGPGDSVVGRRNQRVPPVPDQIHRYIAVLDTLPCWQFRRQQVGFDGPMIEKIGSHFPVGFIEKRLGRDAIHPMQHIPEKGVARTRKGGDPQTR